MINVPAADRLLKAPEDLMDVLAPKLSAMKKDRGRVQNELSRAESAQCVDHIDARVEEVVGRLWTIGDELQNAEPARLRELSKQANRRVELQFKHVPKGKTGRMSTCGGGNLPAD
jgi:hypothetical protein